MRDDTHQRSPVVKALYTVTKLVFLLLDNDKDRINGEEKKTLLYDVLSNRKEKKKKQKRRKRTKGNSYNSGEELFPCCIPTFFSCFFVS